MKKKPLLWIVGVFTLVVVAGLFTFVSGSIRPAAQPLNDTAPAAGSAETAGSETAAETPPSDRAAARAAQDVTIDLEAALADRTMGHPDAPVVMHEFASLTCSHCADFSVKTFDRIRETYIDTGKVYFVYHDFPLNGPALEASAVARCLPEERYFAFVKYLFESQAKWTAGDHRAALRQNARLVGMSDARFDACIGNEELKLGLIEKMQAAGKAHEITSTPSFVFNDGVQKINGSQTFDTFKRAIDALLKEKAAAE